MLFDKLKSDRILAMKAKDSSKNALLSTLVGEIENIAKSGKNVVAITDDVVIATTKKFIKNIEQTIELLNKANENTDKEMVELKILSVYMPKGLSEDETVVIVTEAISNLGITSIKDTGKLMGFMKKNYGARVDMAFVSNLLKSKVS